MFREVMFAKSKKRQIWRESQKKKQKIMTTTSNEKDIFELYEVNTTLSKVLDRYCITSDT